MASRTFIMIKPDGVARGLCGKVLARFEKKGFKIIQCKMLTPSKELVENHYKEHLGKDFYEKLIAYITSGPVMAVTLEGYDGCFACVREMIGATQPQNAKPGTIRGDLGLVGSTNVIHSSDSVESAQREIALWFGN